MVFVVGQSPQILHLLLLLLNRWWWEATHLNGCSLNCRLMCQMIDANWILIWIANKLRHEFKTNAISINICNLLSLFIKIKSVIRIIMAWHVEFTCLGIFNALSLSLFSICIAQWKRLITQNCKTTNRFFLEWWEFSILPCMMIWTLKDVDMIAELKRR